MAGAKQWRYSAGKAYGKCAWKGAPARLFRQFAAVINNAEVSVMRIAARLAGIWPGAFVT